MAIERGLLINNLINLLQLRKKLKEFGILKIYLFPGESEF